MRSTDTEVRVAAGPSMVRLRVASVVGTTLEYYDFALYNTLAALVFNRLFFPSFDPLTGTILAFSTFAVGYLSRPLGALIFGHLGDTRGRRFVLVATLLLMGATTLLIAVLPTYAAARVFSPVLLVVLRCLQGAALGGEWAGAVLLSAEHGADAARGRNGSFAQMGPSLGTLLATGSIALVSASMTADEFARFGWRLPFALSAVLVMFGLWVRRGVAETAQFCALEGAAQRSRAPLSEVFREHWRALLIGGGVRIGPDVLYSMVAIFSLSYLTMQLSVTRSQALIALSIAGACNALAIPLFGTLSDRLGRRVIYGAGVLLAFAGCWGYFPLLEMRTFAPVSLAIAGALIVHAMMYGPQAAFIAEQFPTRVRYSGASLAYTLAGILGGGIAPLVFALLLKAYASVRVLSVYLAFALSISGAMLLWSGRSQRRR